MNILPGRLAPALLVLAATACSDPIENPQPPQIEVDNQTTNIFIGDSIFVNATVTNGGRPAANVVVEWNIYQTILGPGYPPEHFMPRTFVTYTNENGRVGVIFSPPTQGTYRIVATSAALTDTAAYTVEYSRGGVTTRQWQTLPAMPSARWGAAAAVIGDRIYLIGGRAELPGFCAPCRSLNNTLVFNVATQTWSTASHPTVVNPISDPDIFGVAAAVNDQIHFISGTRHLVYTPATDTWTERAPAPDATDGLLHTMSQRLFLIRTTGAVHVYDPDRGIWTSREPMPTLRRNAASAILNGQIYVAGGATPVEMSAQCVNEQNCRLADFERYEAASVTWTPLSEMPFPRSSFGAGVVGGAICVFGGVHEFPRSMWPFTETYCYDPATSTWMLEPAFVYSGAFEFAVAQHADAVYVFGGRRKLGSLGAWEATADAARLTMR